MSRKKTKNKRNNELKIIFFIILTAAVLFILSTYAWFTTQKNVSINNLNGIVEVAEGLEISLNAANWTNGIVLGEGEGEYSIIDSEKGGGKFGPYPQNKNISPSEMLPVSTTGKDTGVKSIPFYRGKVEDSVKLPEIVKVGEDNSVLDPLDKAFPGYFAFDIFLKNSSRGDITTDTLQLNYDSELTLLDLKEHEDRKNTGLQNTVRVAISRFGGDGTNAGTSATEASQETILKETGAPGSAPDDVNITDTAIWEPNSNRHADYIVQNNNKVTWSSSDYDAFKSELSPRPGVQEAAKLGAYDFNNTSKIPTYAIKGISDVKESDDLYDWAFTKNPNNRKLLEKQNTLKTSAVNADTGDFKVYEGVQNLVSTSDGAKPFVIPANRISRLRVYVWLEGQDVDCINYASHGGGVSLNLGLVKGSLEGSKGEEITK